MYRRYAPRATGAKLVVLPLDARDVSDCGKIVSLLLRAEEVAELLGISRSKVGDMIWRSDLPSVRMGRLVRVPRSGLEEWIARRSEVPRAAVQLIR